MLLVFGSINLDIAFDTPRLPAAGETVLGGAYRVSPGGKGANQAHAARLDGLPTRLVGAVGDDAFAAPALALLRAAGVDLNHLQHPPGATGCAGIVVDARGENQIVVAPGVNLALRADAVPEAAWQGVQALLLQMETDAEQNLLMALAARQRGCRVILNNAPAQALDARWHALVDVLVVNEGELALTAQACGVRAAADEAAHSDSADGAAHVNSAKDAAQHEVAGNLSHEHATRALATHLGTTVVLTLGARGVLACDAAQTIRLPASRVAVLDTTGAGDTFCGVLAAALVRQRPLREALERAVAAAGMACTRAGAQAAQPTEHEIDHALEHTPP